MAKNTRNKDGSLDKRFKKNKKVIEKEVVEPINATVMENPYPLQQYLDNVNLDPNKRHAQLLKDNNLKVDIDIIPAGTTISTEYGFIKIVKDTLVMKSSYVQSN